MFRLIEYLKNIQAQKLQINPELLKYLNEYTNKSVNRMCDTQRFALLDVNGEEEMLPSNPPTEITKLFLVGIISFLAGSYFSYTLK